MKLRAASAVIAVALLAAGCGSSGEETFREHQVDQIARKIVFMESLPRLIRYQQQRGEASAAERNERRVLGIQVHLEYVNRELLDEACEQTPDAHVCEGA